MLDSVITGGTVVDGTGVPARTADVGLRDGRIVVIAPTGTIDEPARETIAADDLVVAPGFVDPHTHYDAQFFWDPLATPSNLHGVTSVIAGNCGFTLAPLAPEHAAYTREMMAKVEGMPLKALEAGADWSWRSFGDYLARFDGRLALNAAWLVGHCALRRMVMGEDAVGNAASESQIVEMQQLLRRSIEEGGMGFSTSLAFTHADGDGQPVPSRWASHDEVLALCDVVGEYEGTTLEMIIDGCLKGFTPEEVDLMSGMSIRAQRPVNWNVLTVDSADPARYRAQVSLGDEAARRGGRVMALTMPIIVGMNMSFNTYCAIFMLPRWSEVMNLPVPERMARLRDPETRQWMLANSHSPEAGVFTRVAAWDRYQIGDTFAPVNDGLTGRVIGDIARERGIDPFDCLLDIVLADELRTVLWPLPPDDDAESWRLRAEAWNHPHVMLGGSDAGAHLDRMSGAQYPTAFLADCIRGRQLISMERAVQLMTQRPAEYFGLRGRGTITVGNHADLVVFDPTTVDAAMSSMRHDLPGGTARLFTPAVGVERVIVNGVTITERGEATGTTPGTVMRPGRDTSTVTP